jgi:hypothetical protein
MYGLLNATTISTDDVDDAHPVLLVVGAITIDGGE